MAYFPKYRKFFNLQKTAKFLEIWTKLYQDVKSGGNLQYFGSF